MGYVQGSGSTFEADDLASAKTLLEMVAKAPAATAADSVRTPQGFLTYKREGQASQYGGRLLKVCPRLLLKHLHLGSASAHLSS
jgi:hypothetical protein